MIHGFMDLCSIRNVAFHVFRFENLSSLKDGHLILYVGANTDGADGVELMKKCPHW